MFHRRRFGLSYEGYLITEKILNARDLHRFLAELDELNPAERQIILRRRIDQVACLVRELHRRRISHRDLKAANILVGQEDMAPGRPAHGDRGSFLPASLSSHIWLIDLVGLSYWRRLSRPRRVQNLARLHASFCQKAAISRTDKLRFLRVYLQWGLFGRSTWRSWWKEIAMATQRKVARNARNGRLLA
jgi:serine/threonine protein kinase